MFAIDYDGITLTEIGTDIQKYQYELNEKVKTFEDGKEKIIEYWEFVVMTAKQGLKDAKKLKKT